MSSSNIVKLDIGGTVFKTTKSTLTKFDGFFKLLLETNVLVEKDEFGSIFVDRSPKHFDLILNFMRDGDVALPNSEQALQEILREAQYYLLEGLIELCGGELPKQAKAKDSIGIRVVQTREEMDQLRNRKKSLIFIFLSKKCSSRQEVSANFLHQWDVARNFVEKHEARFDIFFMPIDSNSSSGYRIIFVDSGKNLAGAKSVRRLGDDETPMFAEMEKRIEENPSD